MQAGSDWSRWSDLLSSTWWSSAFIDQLKNPISAMPEPPDIPAGRGRSPSVRGKPRIRESSREKPPVDPRARGAALRLWIGIHSEQGSSPRAGPSRVRSWSRSKARVYSRVRGAAGRRPPGRRQRERFISCACGAIVGDTPGAAISRGSSARVRRDRRVLRAPRLFPAAWRAFLSSPGVTSVSPRGRLLPAASTLGVS